MSSLPFRRFLLAVLALAAVGAGGCRRREAVPFNLLVVTLDTTRADSIGAYGNRDACTPNLDRLAREGVMFRNCYTAVPLTLPSHCTLFTGRYPTAHGVRNNGTYFLPAAETTLAELMHGNGFHNAAFIASFTLLGKFGLNQGFAIYDESFRQKQLALNFHDEASAAEISGKFSDWLERNHERRFFAWLHFYDPHIPYQVHPEVDARFAASERLRYEGEVAYMDLHLGRVLRRLEEKGLLERTLIVVAGDHGEAFGEHGEFGHGIFCYEESLRVPLILRHPARIAPGGTIDARVNLVDVMPSILHYLGIPCPETVQGKSFHRLAAGEKETRRRDVYFESRFGLEANNWAPITGLIADSHKYISLIEPELYDLASDSAERDNLYKRKNLLARQLDGRLRRFLVDHAAAAAGRRPLSVDDAASLKTLGYITPSAAMAREMIDPKQGLALYVQVEQLKEKAKAGRLREAQAGLDAVRADHPGAVLPGLFELEFMLRKSAGRMNEALAELEKGRAAFPDMELFKMILANELAARGDSARAVELCREVVKANPRFAAALILLGDMARREGQTTEAVGFYQRALALEPQNARLQEVLAELASVSPATERLDGLEEKARALVAGQRLDEARSLLEEVLRSEPRRVEAWVQLGTIAALRDDPAAALSHFQEAVRLDGRHALARFNLGIAHYTLFQKDGDRGRLRAALACFDRALKLDPGLAAAYDGRGAVRMALGENDRAAEDFARLIELRPGAVNAHFNLAYALANSGRRSEALAALSRFRESHYAKLGQRERRELDALIAEIHR